MLQPSYDCGPGRPCEEMTCLCRSVCDKYAKSFQIDYVGEIFARDGQAQNKTPDAGAPGVGGIVIGRNQVSLFLASGGFLEKYFLMPVMMASAMSS